MQKAPETFAELTVRPLWREELDRVSDFTRGIPRKALECHLFGLVAAQPERIVGLAVVAGDEGQGYLHFRIRPRVLHEGGGQILLDEALGKARELGIVHVSVTVDGDSVEDRFFKESAFTAKRAEEFWRMDLLKLQKRIERLASRWKVPPEWTVRGIVPEDLPKLAELVEPYQRLSLKRLRLREENEPYGNGYESEPSTVVECGGELIAGILCQGSNGLEGYIDFRAVRSDYRQQSGLLIALVFQRSIREALKLDYGTVSFSVNVDKDLETRNFARRMGCLLTQKVRIWTCELS